MELLVLFKGKFRLKLIAFRDCKDGLLATEGEGGLRAWLSKEGIFLIHYFVDDVFIF